MLSKLIAVFYRDLLTATSYRLAFVSQFFMPLFIVLSFFFLSQMLGDVQLPGLEEYGGDYFPFVLVGIVFTSYTNVFLATTLSTLRRGQTMGTLELVMTSRTNLMTYLAGSSIYSLLQATIILVLFFGLGSLVFGVDLRGANFAVAILVLALSMLTMIGFGVLSGSFVLVYKQGDPFSLLISSGAYLLSGVVYPVAVLPGWLQGGSAMLPHTYGLEALRLSMLQGASLAEVSSQLQVLGLFAVGTLCASYLIFTYAVRRAKMEGSLAQY